MPVLCFTATVVADPSSRRDVAALREVQLGQSSLVAPLGLLVSGLGDEVVFVERNLESSASQLSVQRSHEHSLTCSRVSDDDAAVEVGSVQLGGVTACDGVQHPLRSNVVRTPHEGEPPTPSTACTDWPDRT